MITRRFLRSAAAGVLGVLAAACTSPPSGALSSAVPAPSAFLNSLRPADLGRQVEAVQLVTVTHDAKSLIIEVRLSVRADRLMLVAQDMLGQRLITVSWTDTGIVAERSPNLPPFVSPTGLLADLVAICWPEDRVRKALGLVRASLRVEDDQRVVLQGSEETLRATPGWPAQTPWTGRISYRNVRAGYSVDIQSVEQP